MEELVAARPEELDAVCRFYEEVCRFQQTQPYGPQWHYGVYPAREDREAYYKNTGDLPVSLYEYML